jgi:hypothetical protein
MDRVVHKSYRFQDADRWDIEQQVSMTPEQRFRVAQVLKERVYPKDAKDIRAWHKRA